MWARYQKIRGCRDSETNSFGRILRGGDAAGSPNGRNEVVISMVSLLRIVVVVGVLILIGGFVLLATMDLQPPTQRIEKSIPNDRFQR